MSGQVTGEYLAGYTSMLRRDPIGVVGSDRAVELPADDGDLEDRARARRGLHGRVQAVRADAAVDAEARRAVRRTSSRRACSTWSSATARSAPRSSTTPMSTWSRSRDRSRPARRSPRPRRARSSVCTSSSAARRPCSCSTTPTSTRSSRALKLASFLNAGQDCTAACRVIAGPSHPRRRGRRRSPRSRRACRSAPRPTRRPSSDRSCPPSSATRVAGFVDRALAGGAKAATGGHADRTARAGSTSRR